MSKYKMFLIFAFAVVWFWAALDPVFPHDWLLENYLVFIFVPIILVSGYYFRLSDVSYTLITIGLIMHVIGSHYTYELVPFGYTLQHWFGADRNMYDRLVHFSYGLFMAYPAREVFVRLTKAKGFWGFFLPINITMAYSAVYEIIEWLAAKNVDPAAGLAFLGSQGDIWDAQKDMTVASIGSVVSMLIIVIIDWIYNPNFASEFKQSFRISKNDKPLGEVRLEEWLDKKK